MIGWLRCAKGHESSCVRGAIETGVIEIGVLEGILEGVLEGVLDRGHHVPSHTTSPPPPSFT